MKKRYLILICILLLSALVFSAEALKQNNIKNNPLMNEQHSFRIGDIHFKVPAYYIDRLSVESDAPKEWTADNRVTNADFRNILDEKCYKECASEKGESYLHLRDLGSQKAVDKEIKEFNGGNSKCRNPHDLHETNQYNSMGERCNYAFSYKGLFVYLIFFTGDFPVEHTPELVKRSTIFLDSFVQKSKN